MPTFFSDLDDKQQSAARPSQKIWTLDLDGKDNDKEILNWLNGELHFLMDENEQRYRKILRNMSLFKGVQYRTQETRSDIRDRTEDRSRIIGKIVINHLADFVKNKTSRLVKFKPAVKVLPTNDEFADKNAAKLTQALLDHIWYVQRFEGEITPRFYDLNFVQGEAYLFITWDPQAGDIHPDFEEGKKRMKRIPLLDESGEQQKDSSGNPIWLDRPVKTGDVKYEIVMSTDVYLDRKDKWEDAEYMFVQKHASAEDLRARYPDAADKIKKSESAQLYDFEKMQIRPFTDEVIYYEFYHRSTENMDKGRYIVFTDDAILYNDELPYSHGDFPCERMTDIDLPGEIHGESFFERVKHLTNTYNNLTNLIVRNQILVSHPKWMFPAGSVRKNQLGNDVTMVEYKGGQPPQLVSANSTPPDVFQFRERLLEEAQILSGVSGVARGEPPAGIKAGVALQFLAEQDSDRANKTVLKANEWLQKVAIKTLSVCGDYYEASDNRMIRVVGKENEWRTIFFDTANLSKDFDIRVQQTSALPQSVAARTQTLIDLSERFPDMFTQEQVLDMLDLAQSDKFINAGTQSVKHAEAENETIMSGEFERVIPPEDYEDHLQHWKTHMTVIQSWAFKHSTPKNVQERMMDHVMVHEMFMFQKAKRNALFAEQLQALPEFPVFYREKDETAEVLDEVEPSPIPGEPGGAVGPGQPFQDIPEAPINPETAGDVAAIPEPPPVEQQTQGSPGPVQPSRGI